VKVVAGMVAVGVPLIAPVELLKLKPAGKLALKKYPPVGANLFIRLEK
jgi:hypothetical protein